MKSRLLFIFFLFSISGFCHEKLTLEEKVSLLFDVSPKNQQKKEVIQSISDYCILLKKYDNLQPKARVKKVFSSIKKKYLYRYNLNTFFPDLFSWKTYNCVTGTALIAIIFDELDIPYSIVKVPNHVYLLAYPESFKIGVESTDSKHGIYQWNDYSKQLAIHYLLTLEKITPQDIKQNGVDVLIERYFYVRSNLTFRNLIGIHFFNKALRSNINGSNENALKFANLAYNYDPGDQTYFLKGSILTDLLSETENSGIKYMEYLTMYFDIETNPSRIELTQLMFEGSIYNAFHKRDDLDFIDSSMVLINKNISDPNSKKVLLSCIKLERASWLATQARYKKALKYALEGYKMDSTNKRFEKLITPLLLIEMTDDIYDEDEIYLDSIIASKTAKLPFLNQSFMFRKFIFISYAELAAEAFFYGIDSTGQTCLEKIEPYLDDNELMEDDEVIEQLSITYGQMAVFFFRERNVELARQWIDKALAINPSSPSLKRKKVYIEENEDYYLNKSTKHSELERLIEEFESIREED